jgi:hypothetical protein
MLAVVVCAVALAPAPAQATSSSALYRLAANNSFSHKYKFTRYNSNADPCYYRVRYGRYGTTPYGQIRFYDGLCGGTQIAVIVAHPGTGQIEYAWQDGTTAGVDSCGPYFEAQATSAPDHTVVGLYVKTPHGYAISYWPDRYSPDTSYGC